MHPVAFAGPALLAGEWERCGLKTREEIAHAIHRAVMGLRSTIPTVGLQLGDAIARFFPGGDLSFRQVSLSTEEAFSAEMLGMSAAACRELVRASQALASLPEMRASYVAGLVPPSKLRRIIRVATPDTERAWLRLASRHGERRLAATVAAFRAGNRQVLAQAAAVEEDTDDVAEAPGRIILRLQPWQAAFFTAQVLDGVRAIAGSNLRKWQCMEMLCADAAASMDDVELPEIELAVADRGVRAIELTDRVMADLASRWRRKATGVDIVLPEPKEAKSLEDAVRAMVHCRQLLHRAEAERATLLSYLEGQKLWSCLGASSLASYATRALNMSPRDFHESLAIAKRMSMLPRIQRAWLKGSIPALSAQQVAAIAENDTDDAWFAYWERCTGKRLRAERTWQEVALLTMPYGLWIDVTRGGRPQPERSMHDLRASMDAMVAACVRREEEAPAISPKPARMTMSFEAPEPVARLVRAVLDSTARKIGPGACDGDAIVGLFSHFVKDNVPPEAELRKRLRKNLRALRRDGWQCANPRCCRRRGLHVHHVIYRSRGGPDELWNLVTLCWACHRLIHDGLLKLKHGPDRVLIFEEPWSGVRWREGLRVA